MCLILISLTLLVAFFSAIEKAFVLSNKIKLESQKKKSKLFCHIANALSRNPMDFITAMFIGGYLTLVLFTFAAYTTFELQTGSTGQLGVTLGVGEMVFVTLLSSLAVIVFAKFIPSIIVGKNPNGFYMALALPAYIFYILFYPLAKLASLIPTMVTINRTGELYNSTGFDKEELVQMLDHVSQESEEEGDKNIKLIQNALDFSALLVRDCMVPRVDIEAVESDSSVKFVLKRFVETQFSRLMVYQGTVDNIVGYVSGKSLYQNPESISQIITEIDYVPETMPAQRLLANFIKNHRSVAVVIDEFGGTAGMVAIEDILEEIFGEIEDEHDKQSLVEKKISDTEYIFAGRLEIEYINEKYQLNFPESDDYDTLAGYVIYIHQQIPASGDVITDGSRQIKVLRADTSKVELVRLTIVP